MPKVVTQSDIDAVSPGGTLAVAVDDTITPLARERAASRGVTLARGGGADIGEESTRTTVRAVTRAVVGRLGDAGPQVIEAVIQEVMAALAQADGATHSPPPASPRVNEFKTPRGAILTMAPGQTPTVDHCAACVEQERSRTHQRAVMTTTGKNQKGIVARVTARVAELGGDILDISQTLVGDYFTMIIVVDVASLATPFARFQEEMQTTCREMNCQVMIMHEDVMASLHRV